jgi:hypothetical protein
LKANQFNEMALIHLALFFTVLFAGASANFDGSGLRSIVANLTDTQRDQLENIIENSSSTKAQIKKNVEDWVNSQNSQAIKVL